MQVCQVFRDYYESGASVVNKSWGILSLVRTAYLEDLANLTKTVLSGKQGEVTMLNPTEVWRYPLIDYRNNVFFDFDRYIQKCASEVQYEQFKQLMQKTVYVTYTREFSGTVMSSENCSGIATYIPLNQWSDINEKYNELEWTRFVYGQ